MADPLSITAALLAVITSAIQSTKSLHETVKRFRGRDKTLRRLQNELEDLTKILDSLTKVTNADESMLTLLQGPIERCSQVCHEFELSMETFGRRSKATFLDWTKMEFMRGDINEFIDTIAGYKSTISVGLGTITMHTSKVSHHVLLEYNEMIQNTTYDLELHLQRIDEKLTQLIIENVDISSEDINLKDEREVTRQCIRICEDARSYIESLSDRQSSLLNEAPQKAAVNRSFEAQMRTRQVLDDNRERLNQTIGHLVERFESLVQNEDSGNDNERLRLQSDLEMSKQCLDICKVASEISRQKVYRIGEIIADGDSDQVVVTTLADLFDIERAQSKGHSAQLVGSMTDESLRLLAEERYKSRFGAHSGSFNTADVETISSAGASETQRRGPQTVNHEESHKPRTRRDPPSSNEMRKRSACGDMDAK